MPIELLEPPAWTPRFIVIHVQFLTVLWRPSEWVNFDKYNPNIIGNKDFCMFLHIRIFGNFKKIVTIKQLQVH